MNVIGQWKDVQFFLALLENYPLKITVKSVSLSTFGTYEVKGKNVPEWSGDFEFTALKLKDTQ